MPSRLSLRCGFALLGSSAGCVAYPHLAVVATHVQAPIDYRFTGEAAADASTAH